MTEEVGGLQPWQLFTALFAAFWAVSSYFDHLLMTLVFAVSFGVLTEIACKYINGEKLSYSPKKERLSSLVSLAKEEAGLVPNLTHLARAESSHRRADFTESERNSATYQTLLSNEKIWLEAEMESQYEEEMATGDVEDVEVVEVDEDGGPPPPLPDRDYLKDTEDTMDEVSKRLSQHLEEDLLLAAEAEEDAIEAVAEINNLDDYSNAPAENDAISNGDSALYPHNLTEEPEAARRISGQEGQSDDANNHNHADEPYPDYTVERHIVVSNMDAAVEIVGEILEDHGAAVEEDAVLDSEEAVLNPGDDYLDLEDEKDRDGEPARKFYAPDSSSDDEELEEEYANREVNLDESEEEEEIEAVAMQNEEAKSSAFVEEQQPMPPTDAVRDASHDANRENEGSLSAHSSQQNSPAKSGNDDPLGMDLTDPSLEHAATKIQSVFKGFQTRKKLLANRQ